MNATIINNINKTSNSFAFDSKWSDSVVFTVLERLEGDTEI